jgi:hypothetical protein
MLDGFSPRSLCGLCVSAVKRLSNTFTAEDAEHAEEAQRMSDPFNSSLDD